MPYVNKDGKLVPHRGFSIFALFWGIVNFIHLFLRTLFNPHYNRLGNDYDREFRPPGSGYVADEGYYPIHIEPKRRGKLQGKPPKRPNKKYGGFGPSNNGPPPPPAGGCGCGG